MSATTFERVKTILFDVLGSEYVEVDQVRLESRLADDLGADSLDAVEIAMACETEFVIDLPDDDMFSYRTVGDLVRAIDERTCPKPEIEGLS